MIPFSVLDLSPIKQGDTPAQAFANTRDLAQHAERWGYNRYWVAEHHNMRGIASAATSLVIAHVAANTKTIRVGAGGIMLPNHSPLVIAEQFGTLESLYPGRIDLGLGRAPGSDQRTHFAPAMMMQAIEIYRARFKPSAQLQRPYVMLGVSVFAAESDAEGRRLFTSLQQQFLNLIRGVPGQLAPPLESMDGLWLAEERAHVERSLSCAMVGSRETVREGLMEFIGRTGADELMLTAQIYDHAARLRSFEIAAEIQKGL